jgi:hypothetical protein
MPAPPTARAVQALVPFHYSTNQISTAWASPLASSAAAAAATCSLPANLFAAGRGEGEAGNASGAAAAAQGISFLVDPTGAVARAWGVGGGGAGGCGGG